MEVRLRESELVSCWNGAIRTTDGVERPILLRLSCFVEEGGEPRKFHGGGIVVSSDGNDYAERSLNNRR